MPKVSWQTIDKIREGLSNIEQKLRDLGHDDLSKEVHILCFQINSAVDDGEG